MRGGEVWAVGELTALLEVTATAVRQRIERLLELGLIDREKVVAGRGRPTFRYRLTVTGHRDAGANPADLADAMWREIVAVEDKTTRNKLVSAVAARLGKQFALQLDSDQAEGSFHERMRQLSDRAVCKCLARLGIQLWHEELTPIERLMQGLEEFRQHLGGRLTITMLRGVGDPIDVHEIDHTTMRKAINQLQQIQQELAVSHEPKVGSKG